MSLRELDAYARLPLDVVASEGDELILRDGRRLLDFYGGHCVNSLGAGAPALGAALSAQWSQLSFATNLLDLDVRADFLEAFGATLPAGDWRVFLSNSGAEANENALKGALAATGRGTVVCFDGAFHGRTAASAAVSDGASTGFPRTPFEVRRLRPGDLDQAAEAIDGQVAAVIVEPIQALAGVVELGAAFLGALRALCDASGAQLIFDEVQTGSGRLGSPWAAQHYGVVPDGITTAKGAGAGVPIGITIYGASVHERLPSGLHGSTFGGGPLALVAATEVARRVASGELCASAQSAYERLASGLPAGPVQALRGAGLLLGLELAPELTAKAVQAELLEQDILVGLSKHPRVLRLTPPLTMAPNRMDRLVAALHAMEVCA